MATKSGKKSAAKKSAKSQRARSNASQQQPSGQDDSLTREAIKRAKETPIGGNVLGNEPLGPGVEHEDHEGGETDSLARRGVRGPIPRADEQSKKTKQRTFGAPSIRERQTAPFAQDAPRRGDVVSRVEAANKKKTAKTVVVIAKRRGFYPAYGGKLRHRGDVFEYTMIPEDGDKLPSWMEDRDGKLESRARGEPSASFEDDVVTTIDVTRGGGVRQR